MKQAFRCKCLTIGILIVLFMNAINVQATANFEPQVALAMSEGNQPLPDAEDPLASELAENGIMVVDDSFDEGDWDGWYPLAEGGSIIVDEESGGIKLQKIEAAGSLDVMKRISPVSGIVSIEYDVKTDELGEWKCAAYIYDGSNRDIAASVAFDNGNIKIYNGAQLETVQGFNPGQWYHLKLDINTDSDTFDFYIDGQQQWYNAKLRNPINHVGQLLFKMGDSSISSGTLYFDNVKVYTGVRGSKAEGSKTPADSASGISDDFEDGQIGMAPDGWAVLENNGFVAVEHTPGSTGKSMKLTKSQMTNVTGASVSATKNFGSMLTGKVSIEYKFLTEEIPSKWKAMYIAENLKNAISLAIDGTSLKILGPSSQTKIIMNNIQANRWYSVKVIADTVKDTLDLFIDNQEYLTDEPFRYTVAGLNKMDFIMSKDSMGTLHIDDVNIKKLEEEVVVQVPGYHPDPAVPGYSLGDYANAEPLPSGIIVEAEEMSLSNYVVEDSQVAHNGKGIAVEKPGLGIAAFSFNGASGYYAVHAGYYEAEGKYDSAYKLKRNGWEIDYWLGQYDDDALHVRHAKEYLYINQGDVFTLEGVYGKDPAKLDYVEFSAAIPRTLERGHLIDDSYWQPVGWIPSSWTVGEEGGTASLRKLNDETPFIFDDISSMKSVWGERPFLPQSEGVVTLDFKVRFVTKADGVSFELRNGAVPAIKLITANGNIEYENTDGSRSVIMPGYMGNVWYGIKVIADLDAGKASVYINGAGHKIEAASFSNPASTLDNVYIRTPEQGVAKLAINVMELYKGYLIYDNFITTSPGNMPSGWTVQTEGGIGHIQEMRSNLYYDWNSFKLEDISVGDSVYLSKSYPHQAEQITLEYEFLLPSKVDGMSMVIGSDNVPGVRIVTDDGNIAYEAADGAIVNLWENYKGNMWYGMKIVADASLGTADIYVNNIKKASQVFLRNPVNSLNSVQFITPGEAAGVMWLDDVKLFQGTYISNVPEPIAASVESPYLVGVQTCDFWREGGHFGYDAIAPYDNRTPLMGYFDEGNPEVADWETKWMVEHGIGLYYPAWYRPKGSLGSPVKEPRNSAKLHQGFMNSKYSDRISFAILWENGTGAMDAEDFKENVVNYWIERYFKHPSYLLIDNKPVIGIWKTDDLAGQLGGNSGNAAVFEEIEAALRAEGFAGAIFLAQLSGADAAKSQELKERGYDYTYIYNHTSNEMVKQLDRLQNQKNTNALPAISSISQGWGDEPWGMSERKTNIPLNEWKAGLEWLKSNYMSDNGDEAASLGSRLLLLGNWNEIAEGHSLIPSNISGFGYLDGIREVFSTDAPAHTDMVPKDVGLGPYDTLTPKQWSTIGATGNIDKIAPVSVASVSPAEPDGSNGWYKLDATVSISAMDNLSGVAKIEYQVNYGDWITYNGSIPAFGEGIYTVNYRSTDQAGNIEPQQTLTVQIDKTPPADAMLAADITAPTNTGVTVSISYSADVSMKEYKVGENGTWTAYTSPVLILDNDTVYARGTDAAGNVSNVTTYVVSNIDKIAPVSVASLSPALPNGSNGWYTSSVTVSVYASDHLSGMEKIEYQVNNGEWITYTGSMSAFSDGIYSVNYRSTDQAGNVEQIQTIEFKIDTTAPTLTVQLDKTSLWPANHKMVAINAALNSRDAVSGVASVVLTSITSNEPDSGQGDIQADLGTAVASFNLRAERLGNGTGRIYTVTYTITDQAGNQTNTSVTVTVPHNALDALFGFHSVWKAQEETLYIFSSLPKILGDNMLVDPGMEMSILPYTGSRISTELSTSEYHSGHQSVKITKEYPYAKIYFPGVENGKEYYYSAWGKLAPGSALGEKLRICLQYQLDGVSKQVVMIIGPAMDATNWKQVQGYFKLNEVGVVSNLTMYLYTDSPALADAYYLDDVEIRPVTYSNDPIPARVSGVSLNNTTMEIGVGKVRRLMATIEPQNAVERAVTWSSDNPLVAIVDVNGAVYGKKEGTATITVTTVDGGKTASSAVTVTEGYVETVTLTVKTDGTGDFISPKLANDSIQDSSPEKQYIILIYPGVYTEKNWVVKPYTTLRGTDRETVILKGENSPSATNLEITNQSTIWLKGTANLENLTITARNMRYPVHSEDSGNNKDAVHIVKNSHIEHYGNLEAVNYRKNWVAAHPGVTPPADMDPAKVWGGISGVGSHAWGYGSASGVTEIVYGSTFVSKADGWYVHNREDFIKPQINIINDSKIVSTETLKPIIIQSLGSGTKDEVIFNNTEIIGTYMVQNDSPWITKKPENQYANHADYNVTFTNSTPIGYEDGHRGRALALFSSSTGSQSSLRVSGDAVPDILGTYETRDGGGGLDGYLYGYWDISGIKVGLSSNIDVNNTLGRRLGDRTIHNKTLQVIFEDGTTKTIIFNENYTNQPNSYILAKINGVLGASGRVAEYNVTGDEYYPQMLDKQLTLQNNTQVGIPRFAAVRFDTDHTTLRLMSAADSPGSFVGITLERIIPGKSGRVLTEGIMKKSQLNGFTGSIMKGTQISIGAQAGSLMESSSQPALLEGIQTDWAYFKGDKIAPISSATVSPGIPNGSNGWYTSDVTVSIAVYDQLSRVAKTEYQVNNGDWITYTGSIPAFVEGTYKVGYRSTDQAGNVEQVKTIEFKIDQTAPLLTVQLDKTSLWPPNHEMVTVQAAVYASDTVSGVASVVLTSITSNEPDSGQGDIEANIGTPATSFQLRAERLGNGTGRIYTITYTIIDHAGNQSTSISTVRVPHNN